MIDVEARTMTNLLNELYDALDEHMAWCEEFRDQDVCPGRERAWARVQELQALVDAELEAELEAEIEAGEAESKRRGEFQ